MHSKVQYRLTWKFFNTEEQAQGFCDEVNLRMNDYARKKYPAHYTEFNSSDGADRCFIAWYYTK